MTAPRIWRHVLFGLCALFATTSAQADPKPTEGWSCRNDVEVTCGAGACEAETDDFTPMSVSASRTGALSVCAYSGCWEGTAEVVRRGTFWVFVGKGLPFSTSPDPKASKQDILLMIDETDGVAMVKAGAFAQPLRCKKSS